jgi:hypothetical protein
VAAEELLPLMLVEVQGARESTEAPRSVAVDVCEHARGVSRSTIIVLLALGATFAGFVFASNGRLRAGESDIAPTVAASPQIAPLHWRETYGDPGEQLVFTVKSLEVTESGWNAQVGVENRTKVGWELSPGAIPGGSFGLQLFETGSKEELDRRNREGTLPAVRAATGFAPDLPRVLEPGASWKGTISASGPLVAGSWARVVFGTLNALGKPPKGFGDRVVWITDHAHQLQLGEPT